MFDLSSATLRHLYLSPVDMSNGINGLSGIVLETLNRQPDDGEAFVFVNKPRNGIKIIHYRAGAFTLFHRRPVAGVFRFAEMGFKVIGHEQLIEMMTDLKTCKTRTGSLVFTTSAFIKNK